MIVYFDVSTWRQSGPLDRNCLRGRRCLTAGLHRTPRLRLGCKSNVLVAGRLESLGDQALRDLDEGRVGLHFRAVAVERFADQSC